MSEHVTVDAGANHGIYAVGNTPQRFLPTELSG
jgi:hypothetical protein